MSRQSSLNEFFRMKSNKPSIIEQSSGISRKRSSSDLSTIQKVAKAKIAVENSAVGVIINLCSDGESDSESAQNLEENDLIKSLTQSNFELTESVNIKSESMPITPQKKPNLPNLIPLSNCGIIKSMAIEKENTLSTSQETSNLFDLTLQSSGEIMKCVKDISEIVDSEEKFGVPYLTPQFNVELNESMTIKNENTSTTPEKISNFLNSTLQSKCELVEPVIMKPVTTPKRKLTPTKRIQQKFFSPTKNRLVTNGNKKMSPAKKLFQIEDNTEDLDSSQDDMIDNKSLILLKNIKNITKDTTLFSLLDDQSQKILNKCLLVKHPGLYLISRLYWRQHIWYKLHKLLKICKYDSMDSAGLELILHSLVEMGILVQNSSQGTSNAKFEELTKTLSNDELQQVCKDLNIKRQSKESAVKSLKKYCQQKSISTYFKSKSVVTNEDRVMNILRTKAGNCYKLSDSAKTALHKLYLIMYLGIQYKIIREKKLEWTIIYDNIRKETFPIDKTMILDNASCVFSSRQEFESYLNAYSVYESFLAEIDNDEKCKIVRTVYKSYLDIEDGDMKRYMTYPEWLYKFTPPHIYIKILEKGVKDLKRQKEPNSYLFALEILTTLIKQNTFKQQNIGSWYVEKALILHTYLHRHDEAAMLLIEGFESDASDVAKEMMHPRAIRISRQQNTFITEDLREKLRLYATKESKLEKDIPSEFIFKQPMGNDGKRGKIKFIVQTDEEKQYMNVEEYCVYHCMTDGGFTHAEHWEGRIIKSIFYLLFWDIIYEKPRGISGVFLTYYQRYPLDMYCDSFYNNRKVLIKDKLSKIAQFTEEQLLDDMKSVWLKRPDYELSDIDRKIGWDNISMVSACLGPEKVAVICKRLAMNYGYAVAGFPDVTAWNSKTKKIKFLEVKSDSDKPSIKQIQWMHYLHNNGIDTGFFYVGANPDRNKARASQPFDECDDNDDVDNDL